VYRNGKVSWPLKLYLMFSTGLKFSLLGVFLWESLDSNVFQPESAILDNAGAPLIVSCLIFPMQGE